MKHDFDNPEEEGKTPDPMDDILKFLSREDLDPSQRKTPQEKAPEPAKPMAKQEDAPVLQPSGKPTPRRRRPMVAKPSVTPKKLQENQSAVAEIFEIQKQSKPSQPAPPKKTGLEIDEATKDEFIRNMDEFFQKQASSTPPPSPRPSKSEKNDITSLHEKLAEAIMQMELDRNKSAQTPEPPKPRVRNKGEEFYKMARNYEQGIHSPANHNLYLSSLLASAYYGHTMAKITLEKHFEALRETAPVLENPSPRNELLSAHCHLMGIGRKQSSKIASQLYRKVATEEKTSHAQYAMGMCYLQGVGVKQNPATAKTWLSRAAKQGNKSATTQLALCYMFGIGVDQDISQGFSMLLPLADDGNAFPSTIVGVCYHYGVGVDKDPRMALGYLARGENSGLSLDRLGEELQEQMVELLCTFGDYGEESVPL